MLYEAFSVYKCWCWQRLAGNGAQRWSQLLGWALSSGGSQVSPGEGKSLCLNPHAASVPAVMIALFMSPLSKDWGECG